MEYILTAEEMRLADEFTSQKLHVPSNVLMERAALSLYEALKERDILKKNMRILILAGPGNNGADGIALARILAEGGFEAELIFPKGRDSLNESGRNQLEALLALDPKAEERTGSLLKGEEYDLVVDAIFGNALNRPLEGVYLEAVRSINDLHDKGAFVCAVDIPTGINATDGHVCGMAVSADLTVTFAFKKLGNVLYPGAGFCGEVVVKNIGITRRSLVKKPSCFALEPEDITLPERIRYSNKGTYGKVLLIAGSENMAGAAVLGALSSLKSGCGMVRVYTNEKNRVILQETVPEAIVSTYDETAPEAGLEDCFNWCDVVAMGPGLSRSNAASAIVKYVLMHTDLPVVADADALNIIADEPDILTSSNSDVVITPHVGEMSRLTGISKRDIADHLPETATDFAKSYNVTCVLKDARTVIAGSDGRICINLNGNSGMATAGSGDVLTGIIASLLAQGMDAFSASFMGCAIHGKAGDRASEKLSEAPVIARDIINEIR